MYKELAEKFFQYGFLKDILTIIFDCEDYRSSIVKNCLEIIWNTVDSLGIRAITLFAEESIILNFKKLFENIMKTGFK